jgi:hypothetical protein
VRAGSFYGRMVEDILDVAYSVCKRVEMVPSADSFMER